MNSVTPQLLELVRDQAVETKVAPSLERRRLRAYVLMLLADAVLLNLSFALAAMLWEDRWGVTACDAGGTGDAARVLHHRPV